VVDKKGIMEPALAVKTVMIVALCGAVPTSPSQEELSKAQVIMECLMVGFHLPIPVRESVCLCDSVRSIWFIWTLSNYYFWNCNMKRKKVLPIFRNVCICFKSAFQYSRLDCTIARAALCIRHGFWYTENDIQKHLLARNGINSELHVCFFCIHVVKKM